MIPWYLGNTYQPSIAVIILVSPIILTNSLSGISGNQYLVATNQMGVLLKAYVSAALINVLVNVILIPIYGCNGAAIATIVSAMISVCIQYYYMHKQIGVKEYLYYGIRYAILSIPVGIVSWYIGTRFSPTPISSLIQVCSGGFIYLILLLLTKDENLTILKNKFFRKNIK